MSSAQKAVYQIEAKYSGKGEMKQLNDDLKSLKQVESFQKLQDSFVKLNDQFIAAKEKMRALRSEMAKPGNEAMAAEYEKSVAAVKKLALEIRKQKDVLDSQRESMKEAGFDVTDLAGHYDKLKQSINGLATLKAAKNMLGIRSIQEVKTEIGGLVKAYRDIAGSAGTSTADQVRALEALRKKTKELYATIKTPPKLEAARNILGMTSTSSVVAEINKAKQAYATLAASGKTSMADLARAKVLLGQRIDELRSKTNGWRDALIEMRGRAVDIGAAMAGIIIPSKIAIDFESAMADVRKVVDGTPDEIKALGDELKEMSRTIPLTAVELAKIAAAGGQLGVAAKDISPFVQITAKMATAFSMTSDEAGTAIGKLKNVFSLSMGEIESFGDSINQLGNTTAAREKEIVEVLIRIGGTSKQFGLAKEQTAALAAAMLSLGKSPEVAATGINALLNKMQTATQQSGDFQAALERIGIDAEQMADAVTKNPQKAIMDLLETLEKLDGRERSEVLTGLFGAEFQDDIAVLVNSLQIYRDTLNQVGESSSFAGALTKEFLTRSGTTGNELVLLKNVLIEIAGNLGEGFLPLIKKGSEYLRAILQPIASLIGYFPKISAGIVAFGTGAAIFTTVTRLVDIMKLAVLSFGGVGETSLGMVGTAAIKLGRVLKLAGVGLASFTAGWEIGTWLRQFDMVERAGIAMAAGVTKGLLRIKQAWVWSSGGNTDEVKKQIAEADRIYAEMFANVGAAANKAAGTQIAAQKQVTDTAASSAKSQKEDLNGVAATAQQTAEKLKRVTGEALERMKQQYREYANEIKRLQGEILSEEQSADEQIRDLARRGMSEPDAWEDKKKQAEQYALVAKAAAETAQQALDRGDTGSANEFFATAVDYANRAKSLFSELGTEVKEGDQIIISGADALKVAIEGIESSSKTKVDALKGMQEAAKATMEELVKQSGFQDLSKGMDEAEQRWIQNWSAMRVKAVDEIDAVEERIDKMISKGRTVYINVKETESKASGGLVGARRMAAGGPVTWMGNMLRGGFFPGFGGGDRRHVIAEDGEYMFDKDRVKDVGLHVVRAFHFGRYDIVVAELMKKIRMNAFDSISRSVGGIISRAPAMVQSGPQFMQAGGLVSDSGPSGNVYNLTVNFTGRTSPPERQDARSLAESVLRELKRMHRNSSS